MLLFYFIFSEPVEEYGDLYLDVIDAFQAVKKYESAIPLLESLLTTKKYGEAAVWLQYGECLDAQDRMEEAAGAYYKVSFIQSRIYWSTIRAKAA